MEALSIYQTFHSKSSFLQNISNRFWSLNHFIWLWKIFNSNGGDNGDDDVDDDEDDNDHSEPEPFEVTCKKRKTTRDQVKKNIETNAERMKIKYSKRRVSD